MRTPEYPVFRVSIVAIVIFQVAALFARSMLDLALRGDGMQADIANDVSYLIVPPILLVLMFPYLQRCKVALRKLFATRLLTVRVVLLSIGMGLSMRLIWWASLTFLIGVGLVKNDEPDAIVGPIIGFACPPLAQLSLSLLATALVVPIVEEVVHRGFVLHGLLRHGAVSAIAISAGYFALMHDQGSYVAAFLTGVLLAVQALNYRALWGPVIAHATFNACAIFDWRCFRIVWNPPTTDSVLVALTYSAIPVIVAATTASVFIATRKVAGSRRDVSPPP